MSRILCISLVLGFSQLVLGQYYAGDACLNQATGTAGVCRRFDACPSAIADLKKGKFPQRCGFEGVAEIVCCVETTITTTSTSTSTTTTTTTTTSTTTTTNTPEIRTHRNPGDRTKQKCKDYEDLAYIFERSPVLMIGSQPTKRSICPWNSDVTPIIIHGEEAKRGEFPHMALVGVKIAEDEISWKCGGSLISENFVITAAHCLYYREYGTPTTVRLGDLNYTDTSDDQYVQQIDIQSVHEHPDYNDPINYNDIGLLKLAKPAKLNVYVKPICLYTSETVISEKVLVTGWGQTEYAGGHSDHLLKAALDVFSTEQCNKTYKSDRRRNPRGIDGRVQLCAGSFTDRKDTCQGDSGGPIQIRAKDTHCSYYLLGVTSRGKVCGHQNIPSIYTRCFAYIEWIENIVWP